MFKFKADTGVKAETVRAEAKQGARSLRAAKKNAEKRGKKLSPVGVIIAYTKDQPAIRKILDARGTRGKITARGLTSKKNQRALASAKNQKRDQRAIQNAIQGRSPDAARAMLASLQTDKDFQRAVRKAGGGSRLSFTISTLKKRAAGKDVGKIYKRPNPGPSKATGGKPKPRKK